MTEFTRDLTTDRPLRPPGDEATASITPALFEVTEAASGTDEYYDVAAGVFVTGYAVEDVQAWTDLELVGDGYLYLLAYYNYTTLDWVFKYESSATFPVQTIENVDGVDYWAARYPVARIVDGEIKQMVLGAIFSARVS